MYGRYHIVQPSNFYSAANAWNLSQHPVSGSPNAALATTYTTNAQGDLVSTGQVQRLTPEYQVLRSRARILPVLQPGRRLQSRVAR